MKIFQPRLRGLTSAEDTVDVLGNRIINLGAPVDQTDAARLQDTGGGGGGAPEFYLTVKQTDGLASFSGISVLNFGDGFYLSQNDPNTDEVIINLRVPEATEVFTGVHTTAVIDFGETYIDFDLGLELTKTAAFAHTADSAVVTANFTGLIQISGHSTIFSPATSGADRVGFLIRVVKDSGAGFVEVTGSEVGSYIRENPGNNQSEGCAAVSVMIIPVTSGDEFKLQVRRSAGSGQGGDVDTIANRTVFTLRSIIS